MAASCDNDVYVTWLYGEGDVRLTRIGRAPLHTADALTTHHYGTFRGENMTISTVKALATRNHPDAESYDQYTYLQAPWSERWSRDVQDSSIVHLFDNNLVILSGSSLVAVDIATGMFRRQLELGQRLTTTCHAHGSEYMYVLGHDVENARTTVWCIEIGTLEIDWSSDFEDRVATVCDATPDDQRVYVAGDFGLAQLETATGAGVWIVETFPVSAVVSDSYGNAVVLSNSPDTTVTVQLVERLTGRLHTDALDQQQGVWPLFRFLEKNHLYITSATTIGMILSLCFACLVVRRSAKIGTPAMMQRSGRERPRLAKQQQPPRKPHGLATWWEEKPNPKFQDMDPLLRSKNVV
jgi:hypothetical protein